MARPLTASSIPVPFTTSLQQAMKEGRSLPNGGQVESDDGDVQVLAKEMDRIERGVSDVNG